MSLEGALMSLGKAALERAPDLIDAIKAGNKQEARDIAEEMARREAFDALMAERAKKKRKQ